MSLTTVQARSRNQHYHNSNWEEGKKLIPCRSICHSIGWNDQQNRDNTKNEMTPFKYDVTTTVATTYRIEITLQDWAAKKWCKLTNNSGKCRCIKLQLNNTKAKGCRIIDFELAKRHEPVNKNITQLNT